MIFTPQNAGQILARIYAGINSIFQKQFDDTLTHWDQIATPVPSNNESETYGWIAALPRMKQWLGDKVVEKLSAHGYSITNIPYEATFGIPRTKIEDDALGFITPVVTGHAQAAKEWKDDLVDTALTKGFTELCFDGKPFYATNHPVGEGKTAKIVSNKLTVELSADSKALAQASYGLARTMIMSMKDAKGRSLKITPDLLVVPPALEAVGKALLEDEKFPDGTKNPFKDTAKLLVIHSLDTDTEWHLMCTKKVLKPIILQVRKEPKPVANTDPSSDNVFNRGEYLFSVEARGAAGYGLPYLAVGSTGA